MQSRSVVFGAEEEEVEEECLLLLSLRDIREVRELAATSEAEALTANCLPSLTAPSKSSVLEGLDLETETGMTH